MERAEFGVIIAELAAAMGKPLDQVTLGAYFKVLKDVPVGLFQAASEQMMRSSREFFPKAGELLAACELYRRQFIAAHPYQGCIDCEHSRGWIELEGRMHRCGCWTRHRAQLETWGVGKALAELPGEEQAQSEQHFPTVEQLPAPIRERLEQISGQKVLR